MRNLDGNPNVLSWSSEEIVIPYKSPIDGRRHRYFPDFYVEIKKPNGKIEKLLIEVKPRRETKPPRKGNKNYINEVKTYGINTAKWEAARDVCEHQGWKFMIITERELYGK